MCLKAPQQVLGSLSVCVLAAPRLHICRACRIELGIFSSLFFQLPGTNPLNNLHHAMPLFPPFPYLKATSKQSVLLTSPDGEDRGNTRCNQTQLGPSAAVYPQHSCPSRTPRNCMFICEKPPEGSYKHFVMYRATAQP